MSNTVQLIGIEAEELCWLRMLVSLLRHPNPSVPELTQQALLYLTEAARKDGRTEGEVLDQAG